MSAHNNYWSRTIISRRTALRRAAAVGGGAVALGLVACRGSGRAGKSAGSAASSRAAQGPNAAPLDSTKGKSGGSVRIQASNHPGTLVLIATNNSQLAKLAGFTHSGLLQFRYGRQGIDSTDIGVEPDLAQALPEQPDDQTYVYKLEDARFHNGRSVTAEDVKYSYERYAFWDRSAYKVDWSWLDRVETPDPKTVVVKTKAPFADGLTSMAARNDAFILAREHEEGPEAPNKLMGSGPFLFVDTTPPIATRFKKNPDYFLKPYPYFDEVQLLGNSDDARRQADFQSRQTNVSYGFSYEARDQFRQTRKDAVEWTIQYGTHYLVFRTDQPPFNDKRVRQALSMTIDRKKVREATTEGEGEDDQVLTWTAKAWGFRKPSDLGTASKYWKYDPQTAKQLLSAAGVKLPIQADFSHWDDSVLGAAFVAHATLAAASWRELGIAELNEHLTNFASASTTTNVGNYSGMWLSANALMNGPTFGTLLVSHFFSPPEGVKPPTINSGYVNNPELSRLVQKQLTQLNKDERKQTLRQIEDILAEEQYRVGFSSYGSFPFTDSFVKNVSIPKYWFSGSIQFVKYWWLDKA